MSCSVGHEASTVLPTPRDAAECRYDLLVRIAPGGKRTSLTSVLLLLVLGALGACGEVTDDSETAPSAGEKRPKEEKPRASKPKVVPYTKVTDGTWGDEDFYDTVGFEEATPLATLDEYRFQVVGKPKMTTQDNGKTVKVVGTFVVKRVKDRGFEDPVTRANQAWFQYGSEADWSDDPSWIARETYESHSKFSCDAETIAKGEHTRCRVTATVPAEHVQNSYWWINGHEVAAWPSQHAK